MDLYQKSLAASFKTTPAFTAARLLWAFSVLVFLNTISAPLGFQKQFARCVLCSDSIHAPWFTHRFPSTHSYLGLPPSHLRDQKTKQPSTSHKVWQVFKVWGRLGIWPLDYVFCVCCSKKLMYLRLAGKLDMRGCALPRLLKCFLTSLRTK